MDLSSHLLGTDGKARKQLALEHIEDLEALNQKIKQAGKDLAGVLKDNGSAVQDIRGLGPVTTAVILGETGDVRRFPSKAHFAATPAPRRWTPPAATTSGTGSTAVATAG